MTRNTNSGGILALVVVIIFFNVLSVNAGKKWVGTWSTAPQLVEPGNMPPQPGLTGNSLRQVVRVSIGGNTLRLKLSNEFSKESVVIKSVQVAAFTGDGNIDIKTNKVLSFNGNTELTMQPGIAVYSDPFKFKLQPRMDIAITIYFEQTSKTLTGHPGSRTTSFIINGNDITVKDFSNAVKTDHWYVINSIDVKVSKKSSSVAIIGNSITDGRGSGTNKQNRWPDILSERLLNNKKTKNISVLNLGIGGNCVVRGGLGPTALNRFERDILNQSSVKWIVIFEGVNDIGSLPDTEEAANKKTEELISAYKHMIKLAHEKNIKVYGATIMPFKGHSYYKVNREKARNTVNEWIRNSGLYDGIIDFDLIMRDPDDYSTLKRNLQDDYLHPNQDGHKTMGQSIDIKLFE